MVATFLEPPRLEESPLAGETLAADLAKGALDSERLLGFLVNIALNPLQDL